MAGYTIKEIYYTLQGEGAQTGRPAVFLRFAGCNLWTGREADRTSAICQFCDTDFIGMDGENGGRYTAEILAEKVNALWPSGFPGKYVVCTGGEPALQIDAPLINALHAQGFEIAIETNGTIALPEGIDWVCMSPKANTEIIVRKGNELKLIVQQQGLAPEDVADWHFDHFFLQPMDGPDVQKHTAWAIQYCLEHPKWKLSVQTHKLIGIP